MKVLEFVRILNRKFTTNFFDRYRMTGEHIRISKAVNIVCYNLALPAKVLALRSWHNNSLKLVNLYDVNTDDAISCLSDNTCRFKNEELKPTRTEYTWKRFIQMKFFLEVKLKEINTISYDNIYDFFCRRTGCDTCIYCSFAHYMWIYNLLYTCHNR